MTETQLTLNETQLTLTETQLTLTETQSTLTETQSTLTETQSKGVRKSVNFWSRKLIFRPFERELTFESAEHIDRTISTFLRGNEIFKLDKVQQRVTSQIPNYKSTLRGCVWAAKP